MNLQPDDLAVFVRIVELGTLSAAARERDVPVSRITRSLARLEAECGVRLIHRTTHGLSLTDEGDAVLVHARRMLDDAADLHSELTGRISGPAGWVRVSVSSIVSTMVIAPSLEGLYERHPRLRLDIAADDRIVDMARDGIDVAIRTGEPGSETLVARRIGQLTRALYASPGYLARHGTPRTAADLDRHRLIASSIMPGYNRWTDGEGSGRSERIVRGDTRVDNTATMLALTRHGAGIARLSSLAAEPLLRTGELVPVLPGHFVTPAVPIYAMMLRERHRLPKVRACIDYWAQWLAGDGGPRSSGGGDNAAILQYR